MLSKEVMVSAPLIVFLYDRTFVAGSFAEAWRRRRAVHLGLAGTWAVLIVLRLLAPGRGGTGGFGLGMSSWHYALTQCRALVLYLRLSFWPHPLILDYGDRVVRELGAVWPQGLLVLALLAGTGLALWRRPALGFAGACFFAILGPSSSFLPLVTQTIAEHRMYLPLAAVLAVAVCSLQSAGAALFRDAALRPIAFALIAAAIGLGVATVRRNFDYRSGVAIWEDTVAKLPGNPRAHDNLANALVEVNRRPEALAEYEAALRIDPHDVQAHYNLGNELLQSGRLAEAIGHYQEALRTFPSFVLAHDNLGNALLRAGRLPEAIEQYAEAVQSNPAHPGAHYNLANALAKAGRLTDAIGEFEAALRLAPDMADAHFNLAIALVRSGRVPEAIAEYRIVLRLNPSDAEARSNLARLEAP
jgi:tetratricopeptide (TPR) repeat protein